MPRKPRMYIPGIPCHVIQRGNNRNACFFTEADYRFYLDCLQDACINNHVDIHLIRQVAGHSSISTTQIYINDNPDAVSDVLANL